MSRREHTDERPDPRQPAADGHDALADATGLEIAVVGMAGRFPKAADVERFWDLLRRGEEGIHRFRDEELADTVSAGALADPGYVKARGVLAGATAFDAEFFGFTPREAEITDPQHRLFLECAWEALENAGYDPAQYDGDVGVFASTGLSTWAFLLAANPELFRSVGMYQAFLATDKDFLATRTSYKLGLTGPSLSVQTACSSSLVAIHVACQALISGECDMALAGGVRISFPQEVGYRFEEGGIFSPDGRCRAFDADSRGTVSGNGAGVVLLKRLESAVDDGDQVLAVIKGSTVNNDGWRKVGFTAPSVEGQEQAIRTALAIAEVDPETIGYVETHGTGTVLGDPIEVTALTRAFSDETSERGFCALGSVKTNIGHLDAAAGVAGLIKTVLSLHHEAIPPSLHFESPNPRIDFDNSPFFVNRELRPWPRGDRPRRAGVSSFGIGGTNAHVVLEEAPRPAPSGPSRDHQLLVLSARTPAALDRIARNLADRLDERQESADVPALADVAFTLQLGRTAFEHRRIVVGGDRAEVARALREGDPGSVVTGRSEAGERQVVFLFPGQGAQHIGMGRDLYRGEAGFREAFDRCVEVLRPVLGHDLRDVLFGPSGPSGSTETSEEDAMALLRETRWTQPALFAVEYSLARLWMRWGVEPGLMIGHSLGEYVAACLAGVFTLEEALPLIVRRGDLMHDTAAGAMLSVPRAEEEVRRELGAIGDALALAAVNGPESTVISGPPGEVETLERHYAALGVECRRLRTDRAFHSAAMEPIVDAFAAAVGELTLEPPAIPFVSNLSGLPIRAEEATDPGYWARHLRETVRFGDGLAGALRAPGRIFVQVGPGRSLASLARRHPERSPTTAVVTSMNPPGDRCPEGAVMLEALGRVWLAGAEIDWKRLWEGESRRRIALPTYPFERTDHAIPMPRPAAEAAAAAAVDVDTVFSRPVADRSPPAAGSDATPPTDPAAPAGNRPALGAPFAEPSGEVERTIAEVWEDQLGIHPVGRHDNFFELGGESLLATRVAARLRQRLAVEVPLADLFARPTVAGLAAALPAPEEAEGRGAGEPAEIASLPRIVPDPARRHEPFPLTDVQQAYWIGRGDAFALGNVGTHNYLEVELEDFDPSRFVQAFRRLIDRHGMLRMIVAPDGMQRILPSVPPWELRVLDLSRMGEDGRREGLAAVRRAMSHQVLPSDRWPLFDIRAAHLGESTYRLHISFDFLLGDAWSWQIFLAELAHYYRPGAPPLRELELSFRDYVVAEVALEKSELFARAESYWRGRLATLPPAPELPIRDLAAGVSPRFVRRSATLPAAAWERLKARAGGLGLTPSATVAAAFSQVLAAWSKSPRATLNLTLFNRLPLHPEVDRVIGDFTSLILLETGAAAGAPFSERAQALQRRLWNDLDHRYFSGVRVLRELSRGGERVTMPVVFTSLLTLGRNASREPEPAPDTEDRKRDGAVGGKKVYSLSQTPQVWLDHQVAEQDGTLVWNWDAVEDLFEPGVLDAMFGAYRELLGRLADDPEAWEEPLGALVPPQQLDQRREINATGRELPDTTLDALFLRRLAEDADRIAVVTAEVALSYGEVARRVASVAVALRRSGVRSGELVAVVAEKGWEQVVAVLAVHGAGAAYLPLDPHLPAGRLRDLLERGEARFALTQERFAETLDWPDGIERIAVDATTSAPPAGQWESVTRPEDLAYVIFTSGSTGVPKGVMIDHRGAVNTVLDIDERFGVGPDDRVLALSSLSFDLSVYDVFGLLAEGASLVMPPPGSERDPACWLDLVARHRITLWNSVPALLEMLVEHVAGREDRLPDSLRLALLSGDWIPVTLPARSREIGELEIVSLGGATEASIWSIFYPIGDVGEDWTSIPYGRPLANQTFHVLDDDLAPRPVWVPGELYIGGRGVALGYWRDDERTRASFPTHPRTGERLYRTGDLGRYRSDGEIEFLGRIDFQVKIQGYRIELGEIEAALARDPRLVAAVVTAPGDPQRGGRRLVAYYVPADGADPDPEEVAEGLRRTLPAYMVPSAFVRLSALPLTANGKIDRRALPEPEAAIAGDAADEPLATPMEELVSGIWADLLDVDRPGPTADFFLLGGDSLQATRVVSRVRQDLGVELPLRRLFEHGTVRETAAEIERLRASERLAGEPALERLPGEGPWPVSFAQRRFWFLEQLDPGDPASHIPAVFRVAGGIDPELLERSMDVLVARHESLRTVLVAGTPGAPGADVEPRQLVLPADLGTPPLERADFSDLPEDRREPAAFEWIDREIRRPFDLERGPLFRVALVALGGEDLVAVTMHHVVSDAWSMGVWLEEWTAAYQALVSGQPPELTPLPVQYADYARWQREVLAGPRRETLLEYWRERLEGLPAEPLYLPVDRARRAGAGGPVGYHVLPVRQDLAGALERLGRRHNATLFMTFLAGLQAMLARYGRRREVAVGSPIAGRDRRELEGLIGCFINVLVLRSDVRPEEGFDALLGAVRETTLGAYDHQDLPFEMLVEELQPERDLTRNPFFQVLFVHQNAPTTASGGAGTGAAGGMGLRQVRVGMAGAQYDLTLALVGRGDGIAVSVEYSRRLFDATTARRLLGHWLALLERAAEAPGRPLGELSWLSDAERHQLLAEWNPPAAPAPPEAPVVRGIEAGVRRWPDRVAVVHGDRCFSFGELDGRATRLARRIAEAGVAPTDLVGLIARRDLETIVGLLAIHKAGAGTAPLDPDLPPARRELMTTDADLRAVVDGERVEAAATAEGGSRPLDGAPSDGAPTGGPLLEAPAYVVYTSGSTGEPKGVAVSQRALATFVGAAVEAYGLRPEDRVLQFASLGFDTSVEEIYTCLALGGTLVLRPEDAMGSEHRFREVCRRNRITMLDLPTAFWQQLVLAPEDDEPVVAESVRIVVLGGEAVQPAALERWWRRSPLGADAPVLFNTYGPTEATVVTTVWRADPGDGGAAAGRPVPIGRPLPTARAHVVDPSLWPAPLGAAGELVLGGPQVALGYLGRPAATAERFVPDPFAETAGERLYRTGDLVRHRTDGEVEFLGRIDFQVKVRGFRVEPGEVEAALAALPGVREAVVVARTDAGGESRLVAFVAAAADAGLDEASLRRDLARVLPRHLVPARVGFLDRLPRTSSEKIDRAALPDLITESAVGDGAIDEKAAARDAVAAGPVEELLAGIWSQLLGRDRITVDDDFFALGGHSLLATQALSRIRQSCGVDLALRTLFEKPTLGGLAAAVREASRSTEPEPPIEPAPRGGALPLSFAQQRLWYVDQLLQGSSAYNIATAVRLDGPLDLAALAKAFDWIVARHEILRIRIRSRGGVPYQVIRPPSHRPLPLVDMTRLDLDRQHRRLVDLATAEARRAFDLAEDDLVRSTVLRLGPERHALFLTVHHIVSDGWSMEILIRELTHAYDRIVHGGVPELPPQPLQYVDFAVWQRSWMRGDVLDLHLKYWERQLSGVASLELPHDRERPEVPTFRGESRILELSAELSSALRGLARREDATLFMTLLAGFKALLFRYTGQVDVVINTGSANRSRRELEGMIGFFVNTLPLRTELSGDPTFRELLRRVREVVLEAHAHQELPFEKMIRELGFEGSASHAPLSPVIFSYDNVPRREPTFRDLRLGTLHLRRGTAKTDLVFMLRDDGHRIRGELEYSLDLFEDATVARLLRHYERLLEAVSDDAGAHLLDVEMEEAAVASGAAADDLDDFRFDL